MHLCLDTAAFARRSLVSPDRADMENMERAVVMSANFGWSDFGSLSALWEMDRKDTS
jgi:mannose-1-phosphate guanylyltransferase